MEKQNSGFTKERLGIQDKVAPKLFTMRQTAQYMSCSYGKVRQLVINGVLESYKANGMVRILKDSVDDHINLVIEKDKRKRGTF